MPGARLGREMLVRASKAWLYALACVGLATVGHTQALRPWTVAEEVGLADFFPYHGTMPIMVSPDGRYIAVRVERGLLNINRVEDEVRVYDRAALARFVQDQGKVHAAPVMLDIRESTYDVGPVIAHIQWLADSSGLVFLLRNSQGKNQLMLVSLTQTRPRALSLKGQSVTAFDVQDSTHYVYSVLSLVPRPSPWRSGIADWDVTGYPLSQILLQDEWNDKVSHFDGPPATAPLRSVLWAAVGGKPHLVLQESRHPVVVYPGPGSLVLSPNGDILATAVPVARVPESWIHDFGSAPDESFIHMRAGRQNVDNAFGGTTLVTEYTLVDLRTGDVSPINGAPTGEAAGWFTEGNLAWSDDGKALLLPDAYLKPTRANPWIRQPCIAVFYVASRAMECVRPLKSIFTEVISPRAAVIFIGSERFAKSASNRVVIQYTRYKKNSAEEGEWVAVRTPWGGWRSAAETAKAVSEGGRPNVYVRQGLNDPPVVVAQDVVAQKSRVIWDPNPQLKNIARAAVSVYRWRDAAGHEWSGGLYRPVKYVSGRRYPLVIQTHGFLNDRFSFSGIFPTAMAARALAQNGIMVLQAPMCPHQVDQKSGSCEAAIYEGAIRQLNSQGLIEAARVGIIGFSYTVYTVLDALTIHPFGFAAASVTDGASYGYWQYITDVDTPYARQADPTIGGKPFGAGLRFWMSRAPDFNMQKIHAPLLVNSLGRISLLSEMWEPYATLRALGKPVDLHLLHSGEHVLTEPSVRLASQEGSVDWFRFWLQGYEDPDPTKAAQYRRWEGLCDMQRAENPGDRTSCVRSGNEVERSLNASPEVKRRLAFP